MDNTVTVIGNLSRDPEIRFTPSGAAVCTFSLASNRRWQNKQTQEWQEAVSFFDVTCWAQLGQNVSDTISKGDRVIVTGRLEQQTWTADNGDNRSKIQIVADDVGPSMRWATAEVVRNERVDNTSRSKPAAAFDPNQEPF